MCILAGCDYLENIPNLGIAWAYRYVKNNTDLDSVLDEISKVKKVNGSCKYDIPNGYKDDFIKAEKTFNHQLIFNPKANEQQRREINYNLNEDLSYAGQ